MYAEQITLAVTVFFFIFYSGYDKALRRFDISRKLTDIFTLRVSVNFTVKEINKVAGLVGLTLIGLALFLQKYNAVIASLVGAGSILNYGAHVGRAHGVFSAIEFYRRFYDSQYFLAMVLGALTNTILILVVPLPFGLDAYLPLPSQIKSIPSSYPALTSIALLGLGLAHVLMMERLKGDSLGFLKPQMRPGGLVSIIVAGIALAYLSAAYVGIV
jgi:hypothetical protein